MDEQLNYAPCGFLTLSEDGLIVSINQTLLLLLGYRQEQLSGEHVNSILTVSARLFWQFYFLPLIKLEKQIEEMYISLESSDGKEIPILINALPKKRSGKTMIDCVLIPMRKRSEFESELLKAKKEAEAALTAKHKANAKLEAALESLETRQAELLELNRKNQQYKTETKKELELARKIQETLLPDAIANDRIQIESYYKATSELSGDIYGFYQINPHTYGIIILDVMGHGISSALLTMSLHSLFQKLISKGTAVDMVMKELDHHLHTLFCNNEEARHYCTAIYLLIDTDKKQIQYTNAGHPPALWQDFNGEQHPLRSTSPPLGAFEETVFETTVFTYKTGGRLLLYTDGIDPHCSNYLCSLLMEYPAAPFLSFKEKVLESLNKEENACHKEDDQCLILVDIK